MMRDNRDVNTRDYIRVKKAFDAHKVHRMWTFEMNLVYLSIVHELCTQVGASLCFLSNRLSL